jgi:AraC family transcriptional regulator
MSIQLPVSAGSASALARDVTLGRLTSMTFPARLQLPRHDHPDATIAIVLKGGFAGTYTGIERECSPMTLVVEPAGALHTNRFGGLPTTVVTLSLGSSAGPAVEAVATLPRFGRDAFAAGVAKQADSELHRPDDLTPLAVEALALELVTRLARTGAEGAQPGWLRDVRELLHARFAEPLRLADVASAVGVEPDRLARSFRGAYGEPMAAYLRRLRVNSAADLLLAERDTPIAAIAADVGFADQSHLTRSFVRTMGITPAPLGQAPTRGRCRTLRVRRSSGDRIQFVSWLERQDRPVALSVVAAIGLVLALALSPIVPGFRNPIALTLAPLLAVGLYEGRRRWWGRWELIALILVVGVGLALFFISPVTSLRGESGLIRHVLQLG